MWSDIASLATPSLGGLLALVVILLLTGRIVPLSTLIRAVDAERRRSEDLRAALEAAHARADTLARYQLELLPYARNSAEILDQLRRISEGRPPR